MDLSMSNSMNLVKDENAHPILGCLTHECALTSTCARVALNGVSSGPYEVIQFGELDDEGVPVVFIEWTLFEVVWDKSRLERNFCLFLRWCEEGEKMEVG